MHMTRPTTVLLLGAVLLGLPMMSGCVIRGRGAVVVDAEPPPPRYVEVSYRPGYLWVDGYWAYRGSRWVWADGYYVRERPGYYYAQGSWTRRNGRYHWVEPRWQRGRAPARYYRGRPAVRDHRSRPAVRDHRSNGPAVRDHRRRY
jgi:hypothetical protein